MPLVLALGKDGKAYLLSAQDLGGIGGNLAVASISDRPIRTAPVAYPTSDGVFVALQAIGNNCPNVTWPMRALQGSLNDRTMRIFQRLTGAPSPALVVLKIRAGPPPTLTTAWCGLIRGGGSPIVTTIDGHSDPIVWIVGAEGDNQLHGFRGDTGEPIFSGGGDADAVPGVTHLQTLIVADGRLYVPAEGRIYAFTWQ